MAMIVIMTGSPHWHLNRTMTLSEWHMPIHMSQTHVKHMSIHMSKTHVKHMPIHMSMHMSRTHVRHMSMHMSHHMSSAFLYTWQSTCQTHAPAHVDAHVRIRTHAHA